MVVIVADAAPGRSADSGNDLISFTRVRQNLSANIPAKSKARCEKFIQNRPHGGKDALSLGDEEDASGSHHGESEA